MARTGSLKLLLRQLATATRHRSGLAGLPKIEDSGDRNVSSPSIAFSGGRNVSSPSIAGFKVTDVRRRFSSAGDATNREVSEDGSNESSLMKSMANKIKDQLSAESVIVKDASGDGRHVCIYVVSSAFEGQSAMNRQRMVYKAMWEELQSTVHAVDHMITRTPSEAGLDKS